LTEQDDVIKSLLRGAPCPGLALGPASARAGPDHPYQAKMETRDLEKRKRETNFWRKLGKQK